MKLVFFSFLAFLLQTFTVVSQNNLQEVSFPGKSDTLLLPDSLLPLTKYLKAEDFYCKEDSLRNEFRNIVLVKEDENIRLAFLVALSHFPELKNSRIRLSFKKMKSTMQAQPKFDLIFKNREMRNYYLFINNNKSSNGLIYTELSFNAMVGWIGHELSHIVFYSQKSSFSIIGFGVHYVLSDKFLRTTERNTDRIAIHHGLGFPLYEGVIYLMNNPNVSPEYKDKIRKHYMNPREILNEILQLDLQRSVF
jgi:hypothetical protein